MFHSKTLTKIIFWVTNWVKKKKIKILNHVGVGFSVFYFELVLYFFFKDCKWLDWSEKNYGRFRGKIQPVKQSLEWKSVGLQSVLAKFTHTHLYLSC